jgi:plastin-1
VANLEPSQVIETEGVEDFDAEGEREARVFTLWLNSLNVEPGVFNFFEDLKVRYERNSHRGTDNY